MEPFDLRLWTGFRQAQGCTSSPAIVDQIVIDSRRIHSKNALFVALQGNVQDGHHFVMQAAQTGARYALVRNDWQPPCTIKSLTLLRVDDPLRAFQEIARCYREQLSVQVVGITGSYGKTMIKDLLQAMVGSTKSVVASPESFNSQIGVPLSLLTIRKEHSIALIEAAISKKNEMAILADTIVPTHALLTHIGKKHMATLGDIRVTAEETVKLLMRPQEESWVLMPNDSLLYPYLSQIKARGYFWNKTDPTLPNAYSTSAERSSSMNYRIDFPDGNFYEGHTTFGFYYYLDLLNMTVKAAWLLGISSNAICDTLRHYTPEPMRTEIWKSPIGATFINDTYCSDPQSVDQALKYFDQAAVGNRKVFVFGGMRGKKSHVEADYKHIGKAITQNQIQLLLLVGNHNFAPLIQEVSTRSPQTDISVCPSYNEAINLMRARIKHDDIVLIKGEKKSL